MLAAAGNCNIVSKHPINNNNNKEIECVSRGSAINDEQSNELK